MSSFNCEGGEEFQVKLSVGNVQRVKTETTIDLNSAIRSEEKFVAMVLGDGSQLVSILHVLCRPTIDELGLTPEAFAELFTGTVLERATEALLSAICEFLPRSRIGASLRDALSKMLAANDDRAVAHIESTLAKAMAETPANASA